GGLVRGDVLLLVGGERESRPASDRWCALTVRAVSTDATRGVTRVDWEGDVTGLPAAPRLFVFRRRAALFGHDAPDWLSLPERAVTVVAGTTVRHPVSRERFLPEGTTLEDFPEHWPGFRLDPDRLDLDAVYGEVLAGSWVLLLDESRGRPEMRLLRVRRTRTAWRGEFTLGSRVTRIEGDAAVDPGRFGLRGTVVFAESEELELVRVARPSEIGGDRFEIVRPEPAPRPGHALILTAGEDDAGRSLEPREVAFVRRVEEVPGRPDRIRLVLRDRLEHGYDPGAVVIHGNVARATHGETVQEVLGSGDAAQRHQRFVLRVPPLAHLATPEGGVASTLEMRVDGVPWRQVPSLHGLGPDGTSYVVRIGDDGVPVVIFGDGVHGARLPNGRENVVATYRSGGGAAGNVAAGSLALLQTRPLGVRAVTNPLPASGGVPPDDAERARTRAPLSVRTLGRLVALRDYETFTRAFPGIGKARAAMLPTPGGRLLHLTVAGIGGAAVPRGSDLHRSLRAAIGAAGERSQRCEIASYGPRRARLRATVHVEAGHPPETVLARVGETLRETFGFAARSFGQGLAASEVIRAIQAVAGVVAVDLDTLCFGEDWRGGTGPLDPFLEAHPARLEPGGPRPAELLLVHLEPGDLTPREVHR
ncbi:MAG: putative baseplate assembly protein, partial [Acidobacteriota bacterium]